MKGRYVFTSVSMGTRIKWVTNGHITQTTMMDKVILEIAKERSVGKSCILCRV